MPSIMANFHGINIEHARRSLLKKLQPAMKSGIEQVAAACEKYLKEKLDVQYNGKSSTSSIKRRKGKWGKSWGKSKQVSNTEYPRRRTGSLQASVGHKPVVRSENIYKVAFGIVRDVFKGKAATKKKNATLFSSYKKKLASGRVFPGQYTGKQTVPTSHPTPPTLYAKFLEFGTDKPMAPRKLVRQAYYELKKSGKLKSIWEKSKKRGTVRFSVTEDFN